MQDFVGKQIDRYRITERLGMGGMAVVYKAYDTRLERDVALKLIRTEAIPQEQHERLLSRFEREAKAQARFSHPNIVPVHDYGEVNGAPYIVMEYIPDGTLKEKTGEPVEIANALAWLAPIADALAYAHEVGVVHRDVKPSNILFDKKGRPILTDFGIAKVLESGEATLTGTGMGVGTPEYMAHEQWQGEVSEATDQYALGVVLFELLIGEKPYQADTPAALVILQATEPLRAPSLFIPGIPEEVEKVLYKALARNPEDRYEDMGAFKGALEELQASSEVKDTETVKKRHRTQKPEPKPVVNSDGATRDVLDPALVEDFHQEKSAEASIGKSRREIAEYKTNMHEALQASVAKSQAMGIQTRSIDGMEMVFVPAGEFLMGSEDSDADSDEEPEHVVTLDAFWIDRYEVTNEQFAALLNEQGNQEEGGVTWLNADDPDARISQFNGEWEADSGYGDHPVVEVSWYGAQAYCEWAGGRLPTEAEWEKAARGEDGRRYPWGDEYPTCSLAQFGECSGETAPVGSFPEGASPYGALDMSGNVWEWVADRYDKDYYENSPTRNPEGPGDGYYRVTRGGSWYGYVGLLRASARFRYDPDGADGGLGFRCFRSEAP